MDLVIRDFFFSCRPKRKDQEPKRQHQDQKRNEEMATFQRAISVLLSLSPFLQEHSNSCLFACLLALAQSVTHLLKAPFHSFGR